MPKKRIKTGYYTTHVYKTQNWARYALKWVKQISNFYKKTEKYVAQNQGIVEQYLVGPLRNVTFLHCHRNQ